MNNHLLLTSDAWADLALAQDYYTSVGGVSLGDRFIAAFDNRAVRLLTTPGASRANLSGYRRTTIPGFPYTIIYSFFPAQGIVQIQRVIYSGLLSEPAY